MSSSPRHTLAIVILALTLTAAACDEAVTPGPEPDVAAAAVASGASVAVTPAGPERYRFTASGDFAAASWFDDALDGWTFAFVSVSRTGTGAGASAFLDYFAERCRITDPDWWFVDCELIAAGWGPVPSADLAGGARSSLRLDTNTATNPDFHVFAGPAGPVRITWERSPYFTWEVDGRRLTRFGEYSTTRTGPETFSSAWAAGSLPNLVLPDTTPGDLGWSRGSVIVSGGF